MTITTTAPADTASREARVISTAWTALAAVTTAAGPLGMAGMLDALRTAASQMASAVLGDAFPDLVASAPTTGRGHLAWKGDGDAYLEITIYDGTCVDLVADLPTAVAGTLAAAALGDSAEWRDDDEMLIRDFTTARPGSYYAHPEDGPEHSATIRPDGMTVLHLNALTVPETREGLAALRELIPATA
jgi:hypothetical protein